VANVRNVRGVKTTVGNIDAIVANFYATDKKVQAAVRRVVKRNGKDVQRLTKSLAPVDTGKMKRNVRLEFSESGLRFEVGWWNEDFIEDEHFYPFYQEFGSARNAAQPSLGPAYDMNRPIYQAELRAEIKKAVASVRKKVNDPKRKQ
jgi:HK97 gp10 family phage protein